LSYLKGVAYLGLVYRSTGNPLLVAYVDSDWGTTDYYKRRSVSGFVCMYAGGPISWRSTKQRITALSTTEAEYIAITEVLKEVLYLRKLLFELGFPQTEPTKIYCDNLAAVSLTKNPVIHQRSKHIDMRFHRIRDHVKRGDVEVIGIDGKENIADACTKPNDLLTFSKHFSKMMS
jgi:hypothetical protein